MKLITEDFTAVSVDADETLPEDMPEKRICGVCEYIARVKAKKANELFPDDIVIGCDTIVVHKNMILGKPKDKEQAWEYLHMLSGSAHSVFTGCCIMYGDRMFSFYVGTEVFFCKLTDEEIEDYISSDEPYDKAGGYGIQGRGALFVNYINGDFFNVMGLPVSRLNKELKEFIKGVR